MLKNKETKVGQWESVSNEPTGLTGSGIRTEHGADGEEETEGWKFGHRGKRAVRDPYDDEDFDPSAILKMRKKAKQEGEVPPAPPVVIPTAEELDEKEGALNKEGWSGKIELNPIGETETKKEMVYQSGGGWVKLESGAGASTSALPPTAESLMGTATAVTAEEEAKPSLEELGFVRDVKPVISQVEAESTNPSGEAGGEAAASGGLFKKRRPPPSSRKK